MANRFERYYKKQMKDSEVRREVEKELAGLELGVKIAKLRAKQKLNQTELAARSGMNASKISLIETAPQNLTLNTLARVASALEARVRIELVPVKRARRGGRGKVARRAAGVAAIRIK
jgi:transcriptional regulator with XRE-family HTH domain